MFASEFLFCVAAASDCRKCSAVIRLMLEPEARELPSPEEEDDDEESDKSSKLTWLKTFGALSLRLLADFKALTIFSDASTRTR